VRAMVRVKVKVIGKGTEKDPYRVNLPTYVMIPGTEVYGGPKGQTLLRVEVEVPDDECTDGKLDKVKIRTKYRGQPAWDRPDILDDVII